MMSRTFLWCLGIALLGHTIHAAEPATTDTPPASLRVAPGFKVELIYSVPKETQGSWVALTVDDRGRLIASDQYGGLYRLTPPPLDGPGDIQVEKLAADIKGAHGLLYAFDSLYVMVNEQPETSGLWRLRDTAGNGEFDEKILLREIKGRGEHGPHGLALAPDGKSIYIACGNGTRPPEPLEHWRLARAMGDDQVLPRLNRGAQFSEKSPEGYICQVSPDGSRFELVAAGFRNHYDLAFNALGDLFTYDSDNEFDVGMPWYRPTRIYQVVSGGDYGFRDSSGKLPAYDPDIVPPVIDAGPSSPTGVVSGKGAKFPAKYQHAIYAADWTYGALYAVHLTPDGAGYRGEMEEFITGKPLPLTDLVVGRDGALYFAVGGRRTQSAVYRVIYTGAENTAPVTLPASTPERLLRLELERLHDEGAGPEAIDKAWPHLNHRDRLVRWAARVALERQPVKLWSDRVLQEKREWASLEAAVALARVGGREFQSALFARLNRLEFARLDTAQQLALIRAYQISLARDGVPEGELVAETVARFDALFPAKSNELNRELSRTFVALGAPGAVPKTLALLAVAKDEGAVTFGDRLTRNDRYSGKFLHAGESLPNQQQIALVYALRAAKAGWTPESRREFFSWFPKTARWQGGAGFRGFLDLCLTEALANVPDPAERARLGALAKPAADMPVVQVDPPKGPGRNYTVDEVVALSQGGLQRRSFKRGREMFIAAACQSCHRFQTEGGGIGPDLTGSGSRYTLRDLLENIVEPSKVISDQFESTILELKNGKTVAGRVTSDAGDRLFVAVNPFVLAEVTEVKTSDIKSRNPSPASLMPPGLINAMNPDEVLDLLAFLLSGGDEKGPAFR